MLSLFSRTSAKTTFLTGFLIFRATMGAAQDEKVVASPATVCSTERAPLVFVLSSESQNGGQDVTRSSFFVFRDGSSIYSAMHFSRFDPFPRIGTWDRLQASPSVRQSLGVAMTVAHIGLLSDCRYIAESPELELDQVIRWFGRAGRENTFDITTRDALPECSPEARALVDQIAAFRRDSRLVERVSTPESSLFEQLPQLR
jgi:hypothetical protein